MSFCIRGCIKTLDNAKIRRSQLRLNITIIKTYIVIRTALRVECHTCIYIGYSDVLSEHMRGRYLAVYHGK